MKNFGRETSWKTANLKKKNRRRRLIDDVKRDNNIKAS
jgi:hypothetical protein